MQIGITISKCSKWKPNQGEEQERKHHMLLESSSVHLLTSCLSLRIFPSNVSELHALLQDAGDMDKIMEGVFHNYPSVGYSDPSLHKVCSIGEEREGE